MIRELYEDDTRRARWFRAAFFVFDVCTIAYFLLTATQRLDAALLAVDIAIGMVILADLCARFSISDRGWRFFVNVPNLADAVVIGSLVVPLITGSNFGFLRVLRILRLVRGFRLMKRVDRMTRTFSINTRVSVAAANLVTFIFVVTSIVWVLEHNQNPDIDTYIDALYFTITTLTTTGYGDITLNGRSGRLLTILIMLFGVGFFLKLIQAIYSPDKIEVECDNCGLKLHDHDASHCKHCGEVVHITTDGDT